MTTIKDCHLIEYPNFSDRRGTLTVCEFENFNRAFWVTNPIGKRGNHAHKVCNHLLICLSGDCLISIDDGTQRNDIFLDNPHTGLFVPAMIWDIEHSFGVGTILLVLASHHYDKDDYITDYQEFLRLKNAC